MWKRFSYFPFVFSVSFLKDLFQFFFSFPDCNIWLRFTYLQQVHEHIEMSSFFDFSLVCGTYFIALQCATITADWSYLGRSECLRSIHTFLNASIYRQVCRRCIQCDRPAILPHDCTTFFSIYRRNSSLYSSSATEKKHFGNDIFGCKAKRNWCKRFSVTPRFATE